MKIIHYFLFNSNKEIVYACNQAVLVSQDKITNDYFKVTCKNCKRLLDKDKKKFAKCEESE